VGSDEYRFKIISVYESLSLSQPAGYSPTGEATLHLNGSSVAVNADINGANISTSYTLLIVINGTRYVLGNLFTDGSGNGQINDTNISLGPGVYQVSLRFLTSSPGRLNLELDTYPSLQVLRIHETTITSSQSASQTTIISTDSLTQSTSIETINKSGQSAVKAALLAKLIPLVLSVGSAEVTPHRSDQAFSVGYSAPTSTQVSVTVSAKNIVGPRIILFNFTQSSYNLSSHVLVVTLDGSAVTRGTLSDVLRVSSTDAPRFAIVYANGMNQLFLAVPHFSEHVIHLFFLPFRLVQTTIVVNLEVVLTSVGLLTMLTTLTYKKRTRATAGRFPIRSRSFRLKEMSV
jgi:hypothetical protein